MAAWWHNNNLTLQRLSRGLLLAALVGQMLYSWRSLPQGRPEPLIPLLLAFAAAIGVVAMIGGGWTEPRREWLWLGLLTLGAFAATIYLTGGASSWYIPILVGYTIIYLPFKPRRQGWLIVAVSCFVLASPLLYDYSPRHLITMTVGIGVIVLATPGVLDLKHQAAGARHEAHRAAAIARTAKLSASLDADQALASTLALARELLSPTACVIYLLDHGRGVLSPSRTYLDPAIYGPAAAGAVGRTPVRLGQGLVGRVARDAGPALVTAPDREDGATAVAADPLAKTTSLAVPLVYGDEVLGVLWASRAGTAELGGSDLALAVVLAGQAAAAIANARLYRQARTAESHARAAEARYDRLTDYANEAVIVLDVADWRVSYVSRALERIVGYDAAAYADQPHLLPSLLPASSHDVLRGAVDALRAGEDVVRGVIAPWLTKGGDTVVFEHTLLPVRDTGGRVTAIECLCRDVTQRQLMEQAIDHLTYHDQVTATYNRSYFEERMTEIEGSGEAPVALILADINGLKMANDAFGHAVGDAILRNSAKAIKKTVRSSDIVCRWGGDEFALIMPGTTLRQAEEIAERIGCELARDDSQPIPLSMAMGVSARISGAQSLQQAFVEAEGRMYRNKLIKSRSTHSTIILSLLKRLRERTVEPAERSLRLQELCVKLGRELKLAPGAIGDLSLLARLHDLGKVTMPEEILAKPPGQLSPAERETMRRHSEIGYRIAAATPTLAHIADRILAHHERWDGRGYPQGLSGMRIPVAARILAIAEAYDALTAGMGNAPAVGREEALAELRRRAGGEFDPKLVRAFIRMMSPGAAGGRAAAAETDQGGTVADSSGGRTVVSPPADQRRITS